MTIPFLDLQAGYAELKPDLDAAVARVMQSGWYILGPEVDAFEAEFARFTSASDCIGVANGLDALILSLRALDIGPGCEVIVPSNTFIATWLAVSAVGARPVPVEPNPDTFLIEAPQIEAAIGPDTRAVIPVHLYGIPVNMEPIMALARAHDLAVIEDAAQAQGARHKGQRIGGHGDAVCWSFYPGKNLGAMGDGGAVTTNNRVVADKIRLLRNYGSSEKYKNAVKGQNSRLDPIQAAVLRVKLAHLDEWNSRRARVAARYMQGITGATCPQVDPDAEPVWHLFVIRHPKRDQLQAALESAGISTLVHYPIPPHLQGAYADMGLPEGAFPVAERMAQDVLSIPISPHISDDDVDRVIAAVNAFH